ncbi:MAG: hypothetical protein LBV77_03740 [Candidatus Adiutrix intracellularis]|jgi:type II secretory pathway component PulF|nr:hypothetical protein [Candidatus Adiutrix intracellularis]
MLQKVTNFHTTEVDATVNAVTSLIEAMSIIFLNTIVGILVIVMCLPIFTIGNAVSG